MGRGGVDVWRGLIHRCLGAVALGYPERQALEAVQVAYAEAGRGNASGDASEFLGAVEPTVLIGRLQRILRRRSVGAPSGDWLAPAPSASPRGMARRALGRFGRQDTHEIGFTVVMPYEKRLQQSLVRLGLDAIPPPERSRVALDTLATFARTGEVSQELALAGALGAAMCADPVAVVHPRLVLGRPVMVPNGPGVRRDVGVGVPPLG